MFRKIPVIGTRQRAEKFWDLVTVKDCPGFTNTENDMLKRKSKKVGVTGSPTPDVIELDKDNLPSANGTNTKSNHVLRPAGRVWKPLEIVTAISTFSANADMFNASSWLINLLSSSYRVANTIRSLALAEKVEMAVANTIRSLAYANNPALVMACFLCLHSTWVQRCKNSGRIGNWQNI